MSIGIIKKHRATSFSLLGWVGSVTLLASLGMPNNAFGGVKIADGVEVFGDVRYRIEKDDRTSNGSSSDRDRSRFRARFGVSFAPNDEWSAKIRMATNSTDLNSSHQTFGTTIGSTNIVNGCSDTDASGDFDTCSTKNIRQDNDLGIDQAFIAYSGVPNLTLVGGKTPLNYWQQNEVFWDGDINPEAFAAVYQAGPVTLNAAYAVIIDSLTGNPDNDDMMATIYQAVYKGEFGGMNLTLAAGGITIDDPSATSILEVDGQTMLSAQLKSGPWLAGVDYITGDSTTLAPAAFADKDSGLVLQGRYKINDTYGVRLYYYAIEQNALIGGGAISRGQFSQDDFAWTGNFTATNFEGIRLQLDMKVAKNTSIDLRYYDAEEKDQTDGDTTTDEDSRLQANFNLKF